MLKVLGSELNRPENNSISKTAKINSNTNEGNQGLNLNLFRSLSTDQPRFCLTTRTETSDGTIRGNAAHQHFTKNIHRIDYSFNENEAISNALFQYDTSGTLQILGYDPITGLGGILVDRNGNGKADGACFFFQDNSELDTNPNAEICICGFLTFIYILLGPRVGHLCQLRSAHWTWLSPSVQPMGNQRQRP